MTDTGTIESRASYRVKVSATVDDAYDGIIRLVSDAQRLGYGFVSMSALDRPGSSADILLVLTVDRRTDLRSAADRLSRHPTVLKLAMVPLLSA